MKFEPAGMTNDPDIRFASSLVDYVFRRLALDYLPQDKREALGIRSIEERTTAARRRGGAQDAAGRGEPRSGAGARSSDPTERWQADGEDAGRAALLPVRIEDAAGRLVLRVRDLRQHQRLLVELRGWSSGTDVVVGLHHVQLAMPQGEEDAAVEFYATSSAWNRSRSHRSWRRRRRLVPVGQIEFHLGVEDGFRPATKAHPAFMVEGLERMLARLDMGGNRVSEDEVSLAGFHRVYVRDPFGNRIELIEPSLTVDLPFERLDPDAELPSAAHLGDAGLDLRSTVAVMSSRENGRWSRRAWPSRSRRVMPDSCSRARGSRRSRA